MGETEKERKKGITMIQNRAQNRVYASNVYEEADFMMENICFFVGVLLLLPLLSIHARAHLLFVVIISFNSFASSKSVSNLPLFFASKIQYFIYFPLSTKHKGKSAEKKK